MDKFYTEYLEMVKRSRNRHFEDKHDRKIISDRKAKKRSKVIGCSDALRIVRDMVVNGELLCLKANYIECVDCGLRAVNYEHRDYNKPEEVDPICVKCNIKRGPAIYLTDLVLS